jgi:uncharacterized protein (DUF1015 family)
MHATKAQLSPIFGLHVDARGLAAAVLRGVCESRGPDRVALTDDGTGHEVWTVDDAQTIKEYQAALDTEDVYIADGHHRYTTALNYLAELGRAGGVPAADHPARRCMMVLVGMADPGLVIRPTHRVLGGMRDYTFEKFLAAAGSEAGGFHITTTIPLALEKMGRMRVPEEALSPGKANEISFYDYATGGYAVGQVARVDPLAERFPDKPRAWRTLDVTIIQHMIVEKICQPLFNSGRPVEWAFPHTIAEVERLGREPGTTAQLAVIVRPTPLSAVREVGAAPGGHLMPHKSTYFHPKLATGLFVHPLE